MAWPSVWFLSQRPLGSGVGAEEAEFLGAAAGLGEAGGPLDGVVAGGEFEDGEAAVEGWGPGVAARGGGAVGGDEGGGRGFVDAAGEEVDSGGFGFVDDGVGGAADGFKFAGGDGHRGAGEGDEVFGHGMRCFLVGDLRLVVGGVFWRTGDSGDRLNHRVRGDGRNRKVLFTFRAG